MFPNCSRRIERINLGPSNGVVPYPRSDRGSVSDSWALQWHAQWGCGMDWSQFSENKHKHGCGCGGSSKFLRMQKHPNCLLTGSNQNLPPVDVTHFSLLGVTSVAAAAAAAAAAAGGWTAVGTSLRSSTMPLSSICTQPAHTKVPVTPAWSSPTAYSRLPARETNLIIAHGNGMGFRRQPVNHKECFWAGVFIALDEEHSDVWWSSCFSQNPFCDLIRCPPIWTSGVIRRSHPCSHCTLDPTPPCEGRTEGSIPLPPHPYSHPSLLPLCLHLRASAHPSGSECLTPTPPVSLLPPYSAPKVVPSACASLLRLKAAP